ncbi:hypothetical protein C453_01750 [Haloferax elongans ATCC BAA-1513]|uniref:Uncharacterized protein n=1 Tax=Haloferax elongans ATCC BAA-1513 TaxID=1230453 RepID=M0HUG9_HALEO|nr:hypothetical protein C453_01750 [Haloferax elongans ATCC BAA-1513]
MLVGVVIWVRFDFNDTGPAPFRGIHIGLVSIDRRWIPIAMTCDIGLYIPAFLFEISGFGEYSFVVRLLYVPTPVSHEC